MKKYYKVAILFSILLVLMLAVSGCSIISFNRTGPTSNILSGEIIISIITLHPGLMRPNIFCQQQVQPAHCRDHLTNFKRKSVN